MACQPLRQRWIDTLCGRREKRSPRQMNRKEIRRKKLSKRLNGRVDERGQKKEERRTIGRDSIFCRSNYLARLLAVVRRLAEQKDGRTLSKLANRISIWFWFCRVDGSSTILKFTMCVHARVESVSWLDLECKVLSLWSSPNIGQLRRF